MKVEKNHNTKDDETGDTPRGPASLIVKKYGGNIGTEQAKELASINSPLVQSLIFYEQSVRGWGPKLYGLFEGGRVEEFVDCHTLTPEEAFTPHLSKDVAKAYARFHSLDLPISRKDFDVLSQILSSVEGNKKELREFLSSGKINEQELLMSFQRLHDFPLEEEIKWLQSIHPKIKQRIVLCTMDPNYPNRLVRKQKATDADATQVVIIDFDATRYFPRGFDFGGHFVNRMFNWACKETKLSGQQYPSQADRVTFLSAYLEVSKKLLADFDESSLDSLENVMLEADVSALSFIMSMLVANLTLYAILEKEPKHWTCLDPMMTLYVQLKEQFSSKYSHLLTN